MEQKSVDEWGQLENSIQVCEEDTPNCNNVVIQKKKYKKKRDRN